MEIPLNQSGFSIRCFLEFNRVDIPPKVWGSVEFVVSCFFMAHIQLSWYGSMGLVYFPT